MEAEDRLTENIIQFGTFNPGKTAKIPASFVCPQKGVLD